MWGSCTSCTFSSLYSRFSYFTSYLSFTPVLHSHLILPLLISHLLLFFTKFLLLFPSPPRQRPPFWFGNILYDVHVNHEIFQSSEDSRLLFTAAKYFPCGYHQNAGVPTALFNIQIITQIATKTSEIKYLTNSLHGCHVADSKWEIQRIYMSLKVSDHVHLPPTCYLQFPPKQSLTKT